MATGSSTLQRPEGPRNKEGIGIGINTASSRVYTVNAVNHQNLQTKLQELHLSKPKMVWHWTGDEYNIQDSKTNKRLVSFAMSLCLVIIFTCLVYFYVLF